LKYKKPFVYTPPRIVDSDLSLAEMREQMLEESRPFSHSRYKVDYPKSSFRSGQGNKGILPTPTEEQEKIDEKPPWSDHVRTLKAQRKAHGKCFKCGDKFQPGQHYAKTVPLTMVEELLELLDIHSSSEDDKDGSSSKEETLMKISYSASTCIAAKKTIRLQGTIKGKQVLILIDSGSACSFISEQAVQELELTTVTVTKSQVVVADGARVPCSSVVQYVVWEWQHKVFCLHFEYLH
jgi:hypothetical protein